MSALATAGIASCSMAAVAWIAAAAAAAPPDPDAPPRASTSIGSADSRRDPPVIWHERDDADIPSPAERDPNLTWDGFVESVVRPAARATHPGRIVRRVGTLFGGDHVPPAANVNSLDEVPNSSWFTNRIGLFPMTPEEAARGPGDGSGPSRNAPWKVIRAKSDGVTPGFTIEDGAGVVYFVKFDPPGVPNIATAAGVISSRILHAAGYNVPEDRIEQFGGKDLVLGDAVSFTPPDGRKRLMTPADLAAILEQVPCTEDGERRAIVSRLLEGRPIGPFDYEGRRPDDPNDRVDHEDRRELRGLAVFAAWIAHFDTKQHNSLDMFVTAGGRSHVRHYLIDFASTLGTGAREVEPRPGWEHTLDLFPILGRMAALGLHEDAWRRIERPRGLPEIGYFESELFDPAEFKPLQPNPAFANLTDRDGYWAAKIVTAFTDEHLRAIVETGRYQDADAAAYLARTLAARRDRIGRYWFGRIPPLDFFAVRDGRISWRDLGEERGLYPGARPRYRSRLAAAVDGGGAGAWSAWRESDLPSCETSAGPGAGIGTALVVECQVRRGGGWSPSVRARVDLRSGRATAVEH